jgi:hypothetical protein
MESFEKQVHRINFHFESKKVQGEYYYIVRTDQVVFEMHLDQSGLWMIHRNGQILPPKIERLEYKLGKAIDANLNKSDEGL